MRYTYLFDDAINDEQTLNAHGLESLLCGNWSMDSLCIHPLDSAAPGATRATAFFSIGAECGGAVIGFGVRDGEKNESRILLPGVFRDVPPARLEALAAALGSAFAQGDVRDTSAHEALCAFAYEQRRAEDRVLVLTSQGEMLPPTFPCVRRFEGQSGPADDGERFGLVVCQLGGEASPAHIQMLQTAKRSMSPDGTMVLLASVAEQYHLDRNAKRRPEFTSHHLRAMLAPLFDEISFEQVDAESGPLSGVIDAEHTTVAVCRSPRPERSRPQASIIIPLFNQVEYTLKALQAIQANTSSTISYEVVLVNNASTDHTRHLLKGLDGDVVIIHNETNLGFAAATNQGALAASGDILVFLNNDTEVHPRWLEPLMQELADNSGTGIVGTRLLYPNGTIQHAGVAVGRDRIPKHVHRHLAGDHPRIMERRAFPIVTAACAAVRREQFLSMGMFDEGFDNGHEDIDLCFRYGTMGLQAIYRPDATVTHHESISAGRLDYDRFERNRNRTFLKWRERLIQDDFAYCCAEAERSTPAKALRWAIKIGPPDRSHTTWGDTYYAESLACELIRIGHDVRIDYLDEWGSDDRDIDVVVHIKGLSEYHPKPYNINLMWMLNHPRRHTKEELSRYDAVLVASGSHANTLRGELDVPVHEFLQAADTRHFVEITKDKIFDIVFVGNNGGAGRLDMRKAVADLLPTPHSLAVWGKGWDGLLPPGVWKGEFVPWEHLPRAYSVARIVLNDHQPEMREFGFVNNRTFDASCCGAVVVSDTVKDLDQVIGVPTYEGRENLRDIVDALLADEDKRRELAASLREQVHHNYSFIQRAKELLAIANDLLDGEPGRRVRKGPSTLKAGAAKPLVSVLMSTYDRREFLADAIASVIAQSYEHWELVVVRDGGKPVDDIIHSFNDKRIVFVDNAQNRGKGHAINQAWQRAKGKYIAYLDDDDAYYPNHLERHVFFLENLPSISMTVSNTLKMIMKENPKSPGEFETTEQKLIYHRQITVDDLTHENKITWLSVVHARELFEKAGRMDERLSAFLDFDLWRRMAAISYPYHIDTLTAEYRVREYAATSGPGQITQQNVLDPVRYQANKLRVLNKRLPLPSGSPVEFQAMRAKAKARHDFVMKRVEAFELQNDLARAKISCRLAIRMGYDSGEATRQLGLLELKDGDFEGAVRCALTCLANESWAQPVDHFLAAQAYASAGALKMASKHLESLTRTDASDDILLLAEKLSKKLSDLVDAGNRVSTK